MQDIDEILDYNYCDTSLDMPKRLQQLFTLKSMAHDHIQKQKYKEAIIYFKDILMNFQQSIGEIETQAQMQKAIKQLKIATHKNLSLCYLKQQLYEQCVEECLKVFQFQPNNIKIIYRIGRSYIQLKNYDEAEKYLKKGFFLNSEQQEIMKALYEIQLKKQQLKAAEQGNTKKGYYIIQLIKWIFIMLWLYVRMIFEKEETNQDKHQNKKKHKRK